MFGTQQRIRVVNAGSVWGFIQPGLTVCVAPRTAACANAWLSCRLAPYSKHRTPPNSSCNAIARGMVLGSTCVARESGNRGRTRISSVSRGVFLGRGPDGQRQRALEVPGGSPSPGHYARAARRSQARRCPGWESGGRVGEWWPGGSCLNFDPAAAEGETAAAPPEPGAAALRSSPRVSAAASLIRNTEGAGPEPARNRIALPRL